MLAALLLYKVMTMKPDGRGGSVAVGGTLAFGWWIEKEDRVGGRGEGGRT